MQRAVASVQLSYRQSLKSISFVHTPVDDKEKDKAVFEDDFLNHSIIYGFNKQQDIDYALQCARESEVLKKPITSIKRINTGQSSMRSSSQSIDLEEKDKMDTFKYLAESVAYLRGLLSNAKRDTFGKQSSNVVKLLGRIITYYCFSPHLATLLLDKRMRWATSFPFRHHHRDLRDSQRQQEFRFRRDLLSWLCPPQLLPALSGRHRLVFQWRSM